MNKTILIVLIHGFKGDDATFGEFPEHLRALVRRQLPAVKVVTVVYPKYETRGDLRECVGRFREWLQDRVIDLEVANRTASPTVDPSVHVFLVGHSMGGIVAADTLLLLASERPLSPEEDDVSSQISADSQDSTVANCPRLVEPSDYMFPHVQGVIAFDTPYLGIASGVVSYGAEGHYKKATSAYNALSEVAGFFGWGKGNDDSAASQQKEAATSASQSSIAQPSSATDAAATPFWQQWGRYAMFAGAAGAVAAGGAAAMYTQRDRLTDGWGWVSSHLSFIGCLARPAELRKRLARLSKVRQERNIGCTNFYTALGKGADSLVETTDEGQTPLGQKIIRPKNRTFCTLPTEEQEAEPGLRWAKALNDNVKDEVTAHISMFTQRQNPAFHDLVDNAGRLLVASIDKDWYASAMGPIEEISEEPSGPRYEGSSRSSRHGSHHDSSRSSRHGSSRSSRHGSSRSSHHGSSHVSRASRRRETDSPFMSGDDVVMIN